MGVFYWFIREVVVGVLVHSRVCSGCHLLAHS